jgi:hypothetical protein
MSGRLGSQAATRCVFRIPQGHVELPVRSTAVEARGLAEPWINVCEPRGCECAGGRGRLGADAGSGASLGP